MGPGWKDSRRVDDQVGPSGGKDSGRTRTRLGTQVGGRTGGIDLVLEDGPRPRSRRTTRPIEGRGTGPGLVYVVWSLGVGGEPDSDYTTVEGEGTQIISRKETRFAVNILLVNIIFSEIPLTVTSTRKDGISFGTEGGTPVDYLSSGPSRLPSERQRSRYANVHPPGGRPQTSPDRHDPPSVRVYPHSPPLSVLPGTEGPDRPSDECEGRVGSPP